MQRLLRESNQQSRPEERANFLTHGLGVLLGIAATAALAVKGSTGYSAGGLASMLVFGVSLISLYLASTVYHAVTDPEKKRILRRVDHSAIFLLIAGTYTPFAVLALPSETATWVLLAEWGLAIVGMTISLFFRRYDRTWQQVVFVILYLFMGWMILPIMRDVVRLLGTQGFRWLLAGGVFYTVGVLFYSLRRVRFAHGTWHLFVLAGSAAHFIVIFLYL